MKHRAGLALAAATALGTVLLPPAPAAGGAILGATIATSACGLLNRRRAEAMDQQRTAETAQHHASQQALDVSRRQYDAAFLTLSSQRERMRLNMEESVVSRMADLNGRHQHELAIAKADAFEDGVRAILGGHLGTPTDKASDRSAAVIPISTRRR